jgi:hypothetical protein
MSEYKIELTDRLCYDFEDKMFFHTNREGEYCDYLYGDPCCGPQRDNIPCGTCGYKVSKEDRFIMNLGNFNGQG